MTGNNPDLGLEFIKKGFSKNNIVDPKTQERALSYYQNIIPKLYRGGSKIQGFLNKLGTTFFRKNKTSYREVNASDLRVVGHKSVALASQNFMMSMAAQGYDTCPMEGFDSLRVKKILHLPSSSEINMLIGCGIREENGVYGERFRIPFEEVYFKL